MKKSFFILFFCSLSCMICLSQPICGYDKVMQEKIKSQPELIEKINKSNEMLSKISKRKAKLLGGDYQYTIPIVVHIMQPTKGDDMGLTDESVNLAIDYLNLVYRGDWGGMSKDPIAAGNIGIQFIPAVRDPNGWCTSGIVRTDASQLPGYSQNGVATKNGNPGCSDKDLKNKARWNPRQYYNVWIVNKIDGLNAQSGVNDLVTGYALPPTVEDNLDGIVVLASSFKEGDKTLPHEIGHALGLEHPFYIADELRDSKCKSDCPNGPNDRLHGDYIPDTEPVSYPTLTDCCVDVNKCELDDKPRTGANACFNNADFTIATEENFMNYTSKYTLFTLGQKERMRDIVDLFPNRTSLVSSGLTWSLVPPSKIQTFNSCTNPELTTTNFKTITVGKEGVVWAGTNAGGLFKYSSDVWEKWGSYTNVNYQDMKTDRDGGVWVAQSGYTSSGYTAMTGGLLYFPNASFDGYAFYSVIQNGLPSRSARSLFVDTSRYNGPTTFPVIWAATWANNTAGVSAPGGIGRGVNPTAPQFNKITEGIDISLNTGGVFNIAGNASEIWSFANNNFGRSQITRHNAQTNAFIGAYDAATGNDLASLVPEQFQAKGIYFDAKGNKWITVNGSGIIVKDKDDSWKKMNDVSLVGSNPFFNVNAVAGDSSGNVYFGTASGLVIFMTGNPVDDPASYKLYTTNDGLPNNNVQGICIDTLRKKLLIATADGIAFWSPVCSASNNPGKTYSTTNSGDWETASNWCTGTVPTANDDVIVRHPITITVDTDVKSIKIIAPGSVTVAPGVKLNIRNP